MQVNSYPQSYNTQLPSSIIDDGSCMLPKCWTTAFQSASLHLLARLTYLVSLHLLARLTYLVSLHLLARLTYLASLHLLARLTYLVSLHLLARLTYLATSANTNYGCTMECRQSGLKRSVFETRALQDDASSIHCIATGKLHNSSYTNCS